MSLAASVGSLQKRFLDQHACASYIFCNLCDSRRWNADEHVMQDVALQDAARREVSQQALLLDTLKLLTSKVEVGTFLHSTYAYYSRLCHCVIQARREDG